MKSEAKSMSNVQIENVSDTAFWMAHYRAVESERADALFRDPFAGLLAGDRGRQIARAMPKSAMTGWAVVIRTCIIDDFIRFAITQGTDTIINLGAGLDTRPYRMDLPSSLVWVEADYPDLIEFKEKRLSGERPRCQLERVKLNLTNLSQRRQLLASTDARSKNTLILTEGVVPYLSVEEAASLADDLKTLEHACYWIVEYFSPEVIQYRERLMAQKVRNVPLKFKPKDWFGFFEEHGWHCKEACYLAEEAKRLGRPIRPPRFTRMVLTIRGLLASQKRRAAFRKSVAYVVLERGTAPPGADCEPGEK
jgi:methyltransferase (TIGR00027 family)